MNCIGNGALLLLAISHDVFGIGWTPTKLLRRGRCIDVKSDTGQR